MQTRQDFQAIFKKQLDIVITPAGQWKLDKGKKTPLSEYSTHRKNHLDWHQYKNDNMAKHYLRQEQGLLVLDIDGEYIEYTPDTKQYHIPSLDITIPETFHTITSSKGKMHFYLQVPTNLLNHLPTRVTNIHDTLVDTFTYGNIFEWHSFSKSHYVHDATPALIPQKLVTLLQDLDLPCGKPSIVTPTSNIQRYNLINYFLNDELKDNKQWFSFFSTIFPKEYRPDNKRKLTIDDYSLSYDLFNKIAVKLTATAELDHYTQTIPALYKLLELWGINYNSRMSQTLIHKNILPSLPEHESIYNYSPDNDELTFQEHLDQQQSTSTPIFKVIDRTVKYIEIDKFTQEPVPHNGMFLLDDKSAQALHPERIIYDDKSGKPVGWDSNVPLVYFINDPYESQYILDPIQQRHTINLYTPGMYIKEAQAIQRTPTDNIVYKTLYSGVGPRYLSYVLNFHAQVLFGKESLNMVLWMAALPTDMGGAGKSIATVELLSMIAGGSIQAINEKTAMSGWGDVTSSSRLVSLEDMTDLGKKEWDIVYAMIKQQTSNSYKKLNMKGAAIQTRRVQVTLSGSSNHRPLLPPSDRRFLCLEPAHLRGETEPLSKEDSKHISQILRSRRIDIPEVQEYVNYLYYLYNQPLSEHLQEALFERSPQTEYRAKWVSDGATNTQNIIHSLSNPQELMGIVKSTSEMDDELICSLLQMIMLAYNPTTGKSAVSYKWFIQILPLIMSDRFKEDTFSKHVVSKMLQIDFKNVGTVYSNSWKLPTSILPVEEWKSWPADGYVFSLSQYQYEEYKAVVSSLIQKPVNNTLSIAL